jgi:uncharacterized protein YbjQ (UPF0145 family)
MAIFKQPIDQAASLESLRRGNLPTRAALRLADEAGPHRRLFTSDLTVNEFSLIDRAGCRPISQVMGSSIFHIAMVPQYKPGDGELEQIAHGHRDSRRSALYRLWQEAQLVGADAVVGVRLGERWISKGQHGKGGDGGNEIIEFTVVGTAVRAPWLAHSPTRPVVTDLSGQDLWALWQEGYEPCGLAFDFCRWHVSHALPAGNPVGTEVLSATMAAQRARGLVTARIEQQATALGAEFVVGDQLTFSVKDVPCGAGECSINDVEIDFSWFGTCIRKSPNPPGVPSHHIPPLVLGMIPLNRPHRRDIVETEDESSRLQREAEEAEKREE